MSISTKINYFFVFIILVAVKHSFCKIIADPDTDITYNKVDSWWLSRKTKLFDPKVDIKYYLYAPNNQQNETEFLLYETKKLETSSYDHSKPLRIIIHGFNNNYASIIISAMSYGYIQNHDVNVFAVDWSKVANRHLFAYDVARYHVPLVGLYVAKFIRWLSKNDSEDLADLVKRTTIVGHSLGAHIAGYAGSHLNGTIDTIVGLDPTCYKFSYEDTESRLSTADAQHVQIVHTFGNGPLYSLAFQKPIGHSDYYPNFGASQPGCYNLKESLLKYGCSHTRACVFFAESLGNNKFWATNCEGGFNDIETETCRSSTNERYYMGGDPVIKRNGVYYLDTNNKAPYGKDSYYDHK